VSRSRMNDQWYISPKSCPASVQQRPGSVHQGSNRLSSHRILAIHYEMAKHRQIHAASTCGRQFSRCLVYCSFSTTVMSPPNPPWMTLDPELYEIFETRTPDEKQWASRVKLFNDHGYKFRPRLRKDWVPPWCATGENPLWRGQ
jgi:hypothetical protein